MATIINDLKNLFQRGEVHIRLIFINVAVFLAFTLVQIVLMLFNISITDWLQWLEMPASLTQFLRQPWAIITYMFMHAGVMHLLFNMLWLYWFGQLFLYFFSARHLRGLYLWGGICGALLYLLAYSVFPFFTPYADYSFMLGASAAVLAIVAAVAYREPDYRVNLIFLGSIPLKYFALVVIGLDLLFITADRGTDLTCYINKVLDLCSNPSVICLKSQKPKMKVNYGGKSAENADAKVNPDTERVQTADERNSQQADKQARINEIREKIKQSGYQGLTEEEKKELFNASIR